MANPTVTIEIKEIGAGKVIERLRLVRQEAGKLIGAKKRLAEMGEKTASRNQRQAASFDKLGAQMQAVVARTRLADRSMGALRSRVARMTTTTKLSDDQLRNLGAQMQAITGRTRIADNMMKRLGVQMERVATSSRRAAASQKVMASGTQELSAQTQRLAGSSLTQLGDRMQRILESKKLEAAQTRRQTTEDRNLTAAQNKLSASTDKASRATRKLAKETEKASTKTNKLRSKLSELGKAASLALGPLNGVAARLTAFGGLASIASIRIAGFIGALVASGGLVFAAIKTAKSLDEMRKAAQRVGLDVERFQEFAFAASQLGSVDLQQFTISMEAFTRRLAEAQVETGEGVQAFRLLFGSLNAIKNVRPEEALLRTADAFRGLQVEGRGAGIAADLFTRRGLRMTQFLQSGRKGIEDMAKEARRLGIIFDKDLAAQGTKTVDALDRLSRVMSVNLQRAVSIILPLIERLALQFANLGPIIKENVNTIVIAVTTLLGLLLGGIAGPIGAGVGGALGLLTGLLITNAETLVGVVEKLERGEAGFADGLDNVKEGIKDFIGFVPGAAEVIDNIFDVLKKPIGFEKEALSSFKSFLELFVIGKSDVEAFGKAIEGMGSALQLKGARKSLAALSGKLEQVRAEVLTLTRTGDRGMVSLVVAQGQARKFLQSITSAQVKELSASIGVTVDELSASIIAVNKGIISYQTLGKIFEATRTPMEKFRLEMSELLALQKEFPEFGGIIGEQMNIARRAMIDADEGTQLLSSGIDSLSSGIVKAMTTAGDAMEKFRELAKSVVDSILESFVQFGVSNPLKNLLFGLEEGSSGAFPTISSIGGGFLGSLLKASDDAATSVGKLGNASSGGAAVITQELVNSAIQAAVSTGVQSTAVTASTVAITRMAISAKAAALALDSVTASAGGSAGGGIGGIIGGLIGIAAGAAGPGPGAGPPLRFAHGGRVSAGQLTIVGEEGPEPFRPNVAGTIFPSGTAIAAPSSGSVIINQRFDFRGASLEAVALLQRESNRIKQETLAAVESKRIRGINAARR